MAHLLKRSFNSRCV